MNKINKNKKINIKIKKNKINILLLETTQTNVLISNKKNIRIIKLDKFFFSYMISKIKTSLKN